MSISFHQDTKIFTLETKQTRYTFALIYEKYLAHLYYGAKCSGQDVRYERKYRSFSPYIDEEIGTNFSPDTNALEYSTFGNGDFRATALRIQNKDGNSVTGLVYQSHSINTAGIRLPVCPMPTPTRIPTRSLSV